MSIPRSLVPPGRGQRIAIAVGMMLSLPAFGLGYYNDDFIHSIILRGLVPGSSRNPLRLYEFTRSDTQVRAMVEQGALPWWTAADLRIRFFRPLGSLLVAFDHAVSPRHTFFTHVHGLAWFLALLILAAWLLRTLLPARIATVSTFAYALATHHAMSTNWTSARAGLSSSAVAMAAIALHVRARRSGKNVAWGAVAMLAFALCFGELALGAFIVIAAWEALASQGTVRERVRACVPSGLVVLAYLAMYSALGYGTRASGAYFDPMREPGIFLRDGVSRWLALAAEPVWNIPSEALMFDARTTRPFAAAAASLIVMLGGFVLSASRRMDSKARRTLVALTAGAAASLVPGLGGPPGGRVLPIAGLGIAALVGTVVVDQWDRARGTNGARRLAHGLAMVMFAAPIVSIGPMVRIALPLASQRVSAAQRRVTHIDWHCGDDGDALVPLAADPAIAMYAGAAWLDAGRHGRSFRVLSMAPARHLLRRDDASTLTLRVLDGGRMLETLLERVYRARSRPIHEGDTFRSALGSVTITRMNGDAPTEIRYQTDLALDDPRVCLFEWRGGTLRPLTIPPVGGSIVLEHERGPMGL